MAYYVPVGPRGVVFRFGTVLTALFGSLTYWRACRRRALLALPDPVALPDSLLPGPGGPS